MYSPRFMRVYITEKCNADCYNCFNKDFRKDREMSYPFFKELCTYLSTNGIKTLKILGGEPTLHSKWEDIIKCSQEHFESIIIFSNGILMNKLGRISLRDTDALVLNFSFYKDWNIQEIPNTKCTFSIKVDTSSSIESQKNYLKCLINQGKQFSLNLSLDCTENIFESDIQKYLNIINDWLIFSKDYNITINLDHGIPKCLLRNKNLSVDSRYFLSNKGICSLDNGGLITADGLLYFCPNYMDYSIPILDEKGNFLSWGVFRDSMNKIYLSKCLKALSNKCKTCEDFNNSCNGNCWASQRFNSSIRL